MSKKKISYYDFIERTNALTHMIAEVATDEFALSKSCPFCGTEDEYHFVDMHVRLQTIILRYCCAECERVTFVYINGDEITTETITFKEEQRRDGAI